jgi:hypothetical protein
MSPNTESSASRVIQAGVGGSLMGLAAWIALSNLSKPTYGGSLFDGWIFWVPVTLWLLTMAVLCLSSALAGPDGRAAVQTSWRSGWTVGAIGLAVGFLGPLVIWPKASLGPLLGILMTGPLGFVVGALGAQVFRGSVRTDPELPRP